MPQPRKKTKKAEMPATTSKAVGRPTTYHPDYCEQLIDHQSNGLSFESFAGVVGTCKQTIYTWTEKHPEFLDARKRAAEKCRLWWEKQGIEGLYNTTDYDQDGNPLRSKSINATLWIFNMKNRFREEFSDRQQHEHTGQDGKPIELKHTFEVTLNL
jgi:hypothetical protein